MGGWISDCEHAGHDFFFEEGAECVVEGGLKSSIRRCRMLNVFETHLEEFTADSVYYW